MAQAKKGLGRGLSALIPTDMDFLAEVARGDFSVLAPPNLQPQPAHRKAASRETASATALDPLEAPEDLDALGTTGESGAADAAGVVVEELGSVESGIERELSMRRDGGAGAVVWVGPDKIEANPYQPRRSFDASELSSLSDSIREHGILQPIIVRPIGMAWGFGLDAEQTGAKFQLIAGERRLRAAQAAGLGQVPVIVREVSDQQSLELAIIENVQRHDISALDAAVAYKRLSQEFGLSQEKIAQRVGKSRPSVANTLRLLDLPPEAQEAIQDGLLSEGHGRAILLAPGANDRRAVLRAILRGKMSVRQAEEAARRWARQAQRDAAQPTAQPTASLAGASPAGAPGPLQASAALPSAGSGSRDAKMGERSPSEEGWHEDTELEERLQRSLSCKVQVKRRRAGGQIVLSASDDLQLERLTALLAAKKS